MPPQTISDEDRKRLLLELRALLGASLQKLWLPSPQVSVLQLRLPGRTALAVVDARLRMAALAEERPTSADTAPRSQATLRNALEGSRLTGASLIVAPDRRTASPRLEFGERALIAEEALLVVEVDGGKIVWASSGALRRPGSVYPPAQEVSLGDAAPLPARDRLVREALAAEEEKGVAARRKEVVARLRSRVQKLKRTLAAVEGDATRALRAAEDRANAELLLPVASRLPRGAREARVQDWSRTDAEGRPAEIVIPLDPALSAADNAQRWLRRARRYQAAAARIAARRAEVSDQLARTETALSQAESAREAAELAAGEAGTPASPRAQRHVQGPRLPYRKFSSRTGAPILVGRSARDNDALSLRVARGNDLWLHARGVQGAHVVVPGAGESPDPRTLGDAALLAAHFSSARAADGVEVAWTRCKYLRKPKGAAPGSVIVSQEKVLWVRLEADRVKALLSTET
ncbi:MAG TPA: NFACT RNA binding domain-containing protein [Myxococcales bacterium]|nr:NFACT RNA binding domain-containing protein [Myxococcales bacterium]